MGKFLIGGRPEIQHLVPDVRRGSFATVRSEDVRSVLAFLRDHTPVLIVLDASLGRDEPGPNALDVCPRLRKIDRLKEVPVVLLIDDRAPPSLVAEAAYVRSRYLVRIPSGTEELERILFDAMLNTQLVA